MNLKTRNISSLIESQLPSFILEDYELFGKFLKSYYAQQELSGGVLDIILNLTKYRDINFYDKAVLTESTKTVGITGISDTTITVDSTEGFPKQGLIKLGDEIAFYTSKTATTFQSVSRGVSGNTTLGDLYSNSKFVSTSAASHADDTVVENISNLFLYALIKSFESEYLAGIPEKYLRGEIDKRTLIKNISSFYKSKGTKRSIQFIFNCLISSDDTDVFFPKETTLKASESDWSKVYSLRVIALSGNPETLIGKRVTQSGASYASAVVDNALKEQIADGVQMWDIILAESSVNNVFQVANKTSLTKDIQSSDTVGDKIEVDSTFGWDKEGLIYINGERIEYSSKTIRHFVIKSRSLSTTHASGAKLYSNITIDSGNVKLLPLGVTYNLQPQGAIPYGVEGETITVEKSGFDTVDPIIKKSNNTIRWMFPTSSSTVQSGDARTTAANVDTIPGISAFFEDKENYYICCSGFPLGRTIFFNQTISADKTPIDQALLRTIRKKAETTTEVYATPRKDVGIFVDGSIAYGYKHEDGVLFGKLTKIEVTNQGSGYSRPPFVLINSTPYKASANLSGNVVESVTITDEGNYTTTPQIEIVSGRNAVLTPVVTLGKITSIVITNPGEYYSAPPTIRITDRLGRGRFADYVATVSAGGQITEVTQINAGNFYTAGQVLVEVIPSGSNAEAEASIYEWVKNRYTVVGTDIDSEYGFSFNNSAGFNTYGVLSYAPSLRTSLSDNGVSHSPIIGFAYDGNPIYGPYGYTVATDSSTAIKRMESGYRQRASRTNGPSATTYPIGTFIQDYYYADRLGDLDRNNGRFCVTPEYPNGVYAYFVTLNASLQPEFPYLLGENFYSLPLTANYQEFQTHADLPLDAVRLRTQSTPQNGIITRAKVKDVSTGSIDKIKTYDSSDNFSVGSSIVFDNSQTGGSDAAGLVSSVNGKTVSSLQATDTQRVATIQITENCFIYDGDTITQSSTGVTGTVVGDVLDDKFVVLENVTGVFDATGLVDSSTLTLNVVLNTNATFTAGAIVTLTDGDNDIATGEIVLSTERRNSVKIKVISGTFNQFAGSGYYLRSDNLLNTIGAEILSTSSLSTDLVPFIVDTNVALVTTSTNHGLGIGSKINVKIDPDDSVATKTYHVQLGATQEIELTQPTFVTAINDAGLGRGDLVNGGFDYATNTYTDVELIFVDQTATREDLGAVGDANNAEATIVVSDINNTGLGSVTSVTITTKGSGYVKGDVLTVEDSALNRSTSSTNTQRLRFVVDHIGFAAGETVLKLGDVSELAVNDLLEVGEEIVKVTAVSEGDKTVTIDRAQEETEEIDHFDKEEVSLYNSRYNFTVGSQIAITGNASLDPVILSYTGNKLIVEHNQLFFSSGSYNDYKIGSGSSFFDNSSPKRLVDIDTASDFLIVTKISSSASGPFEVSPNIQFQEYYQYRFDLSHSTNALSEFLISPSKQDNIIAPELVRVGTPGQSGAYVYAKFGYGPRTGTVNLAGTLTERRERLYQRYYYKSIVTTDSSGNQSIRIGPTSVIEDRDNYIEIINDPLQGQQSVVYVTPTRFVYSMGTGARPEWYGTGNIKYSTTAKGAVGSINEVTVSNLGSGYKKVPLVLGATLKKAFEATVTANWDAVNQNISTVTINTSGQNYSKPKIVVIDGDGTEANFEVLKSFDNKVSGVRVINKGKNYTYQPKLRVIESDVRVFALGSNIGTVKNAEIEFSGSGVWNDTSILRKHSASVGMVVDTTDTFLQGERVEQGSSYGLVSLDGWRTGSNILKVSVQNGEFVAGKTITGITSGASGTVDEVLTTDFDIDLRSYYDNLGRYLSDKGKVGVKTHRIADNKFYQDYSYVIESTSGINDWKELVKESVHPAGFNLFGELNVNSQGTVRLQPEPKISQISTLKLWDQDVNKVTVSSKIVKKKITINKVEDSNIKEGSGSVVQKAFDSAALTAREIYIGPAFTGTFGTSGNVSGNRTFTIYDKKTNDPITPYNEMALTITLDGILQEPETSYTVSGSTITFAKAPLGPRTDNGAAIPAQKFVGRLFQFKDNVKNAQYLKKVRPIFQQGGTWIDAANQIKFNRQFIVEEAIGYAKATYPNLAWNQLESKCSRDIGLIVDAYEHDVRFGGNWKTIQAAESYFNNGNLAYINAQLTESIATYKYATSLCVAAMRNWDLSLDGCTITAGSDIITVPTTLGLAVGMDVSSGAQFYPGTKLLEILSDTQVRVSSPGNFSYSPNIISTTVVTTTNVTYGPTTVTGTGLLHVGVPSTVTITSTVNNIDQVTFSFSRINNGTFMDAANLIEKNKEYIKEETLGWVKATYPSLVIPNEAKCTRDTGYLVDAFVYHLRYGGNANVVDFGERYWVGNKLSYINTEFTESKAAYRHATGLMVKAMRNNLTAGTYTSIVPFTDTSILSDPASSYTSTCAQVEQTLNTYIDIVDEVLNKGTNIVEVSDENSQRSGNYTSTLTYSNNNILADSLFAECAIVQSALGSLFDNISDVLNGQTVDTALPDYFDGENVDFELYYTDNTPVKTSKNEDLFVGINGVFQSAKYDATFPRNNAYQIVRSSVASEPDRIVFAEPPKWEQSLNTILVQEPLAVEKFFAHNLGKYLRLSIQSENFNGKTLGSFTMRNEETGDVVVVDDDRFLLVFLDGVLQERERAYTINESSITFKQAPRSGQKVDLVLLIGDSVDQLLSAYNFESSKFYNEITVSVTGGSAEYDTFKENIRERSIIYQLDGGVYKTLGMFKNHQPITGGWKFRMLAHNPDIDLSQPIRIASTVDIVNSSYTSIDLSSLTTSVDYVVDSDSNRVLRKDTTSWLYDVVKPNITGLEPGDQIKIDGETDFRTVKKTPNTLTALDYASNSDISDTLGTVSVSNYNGVQRGEGLDVVATVTNGVVTSLTWNKRDYSRNPDAYQYNTAPALVFEPVDQNGGGARAHVIVSGGEIIDVVLDHGGSGYTSAPIVNVTRRYKIKKKKRTIDTKYTIGVQGKTSGGFNTYATLVRTPTNNGFESTQLARLGSSELAVTLTDQNVLDPQPISHRETYIERTRTIRPVESALMVAAPTQSIVDYKLQKILTTSVSSSTAFTTNHPPTTQSVPMGTAQQSTIKIATMLDVDYSAADPNVFANTAQFPATGIIQVGLYQLEYSSKLSDRFIIDYGSTNTLQPSNGGTVTAGNLAREV